MVLCGWCIDGLHAQCRMWLRLTTDPVVGCGCGCVERGAAPATARRGAAPPAMGRECLCGCGGHTRGGRFLPGHDSKYLNVLIGLPAEQGESMARAVSEAFHRKYRRRRRRGV